MTTEPATGRAGGYHLVAFDAVGRERTDTAAVRGAQLAAQFAREPPTDVFVFSHGWYGDVPAARRQYDAWVSAMAKCTADRECAEARPGGFRPVAVGVHWPSRAWGDEDIGPGSFAAPTEGANPIGADSGDNVARLVEGWTSPFDDRPDVRGCVRTIVHSMLDDPVPATLPDPVRAAYAILNDTLGLRADGVGATPGDDRSPFDPESLYQACLMDELASFGGSSLGGLLAPLRVLTFWSMKRRACLVGARGVADLLVLLQQAAPSASFHLMGHSFGCIVVASALAGPTPGRRRPISSLFMVQGAMSLWSFCSAIPARPERAGYFHSVLADGLVDGPIVVTTSVHDRAVRTFYPLGARSRGQVDYLPDELPIYGAIGTFGVRGPGVRLVDAELRPVDVTYPMQPGSVHNLRADNVIRRGGGLMGAHSDIARPEVAHALWQAALSAPPAVEGSRQQSVSTR